MPRELCYLYGAYMDDYMHDLDICQRFAAVNRETMAEDSARRRGPYRRGRLSDDS